MKVIPFPKTNHVVLSSAEYKRLNVLKEKVDVSIHPAEVKLYASEIKRIIDNAKIRVNSRR